MRKTAQTVLSGALCTAMVAAFSPAAAFAAAAPAPNGNDTQLSALSVDDEWDDAEEDEDDDYEDEQNVNFYYFHVWCDPGFGPDEIAFDSAREYDWDDEPGEPLTIHKGKDYTLGTQWYKCISKSGDVNDYDYVPFSGTPSEPGTYALEVTGIGEYYGTTYAYLTIDDPFDLNDSRYRIDIETQEFSDYDPIIDETTDAPELSVTSYDYDAGTDTVLEEGVDYERVGWYKVVYDDETGDATCEPVGPKVTEPGEYRYGVKGIGKYHGIGYSYSCDWYSPHDLNLYYKDIKTQMQLGKDDLNNVKATVSRTKSNGEKVTLVQDRDFRIGKWYSTDVSGGSWETNPDKIIATPTKTGVYGITIEGIGAYAGSKAYYDITVFKPKMTFSLPYLYNDVLTGNTKITSLTLSSKVTGVGYRALSGCKNLSKLTLGKNVEIIDECAFEGCKKLKTVTVKTAKLTKKGLDSDTFKGSSVTTIKVDTGSKKTDKKVVKAYKKLFTKKICGKNLAVK